MASTHVLKMSAIFKYFNDRNLNSRGENAYESGHVIKIFYEDSVRIMKGQVKASMRDRVYDVEIKLTPDYEIQTVHCTCPKGLHMCHHMIAITIFAYHNISVTDKSCSWSAIKQKGKDKVQTIEDMYPGNTSFRATSRPATVNEVTAFTEKIKIYGDAVGFSWLLQEEPKNESYIHIINVEEIIFSPEYHKAANKEAFIRNKLEVSQETSAEIAKQTTGQWKNPLWQMARKNSLTASNFHMILSRIRTNKYTATLFQRLSGNDNLDHIKAIQWGREHEEVARSEFETATHLKVIPTGLWLDACGFLGASPDGLVEDDGILEIKCPFKYRQLSLTEGLKKGDNYILQFSEDDELIVNKKHEYYIQIQGQLALTHKQKCYLYIWTPTESLLHVVFAEDFSQELNKLKQFYFAQYIPFLMGEKTFT